MEKRIRRISKGTRRMTEMRRMRRMRRMRGMRRMRRMRKMSRRINSWAGLGWAELARLPRLGWLGRNGWDRLGGAGLAWAGLGSPEPSWAELGCAGAWLDSSRLSWTGLG